MSTTSVSFASWVIRRVTPREPPCGSSIDMEAQYSTARQSNIDVLYKMPACSLRIQSQSMPAQACPCPAGYVHTAGPTCLAIVSLLTSEDLMCGIEEAAGHLLEPILAQHILDAAQPVILAVLKLPTPIMVIRDFREAVAHLLEPVLA